jgi:GTPase Era involved in 16S rRNA processing
MRVILIEEERFAEVADLMRQAATELHESAYLLNKCGLTPEQAKFAADEMFRSINFTFVRWAQSHGASCVHR